MSGPSDKALEAAQDAWYVLDDPSGVDLINHAVTAAHPIIVAERDTQIIEALRAAATADPDWADEFGHAAAFIEQWVKENR